MKIFEFGTPGNQTIMCLPGNFMTHRQFKNIVPMLKQACQKLTLETTEATFWEALKLYPEHMSTWEPNPDTRISCWYGEKVMNMKKTIKHLKRAFPNLEVHPFKGLGHGEIMAHPELLVRELRAFLK